MAKDSNPPFLPYGRHVIDEADVLAVTQVLRGDWLTTGPTVSLFEQAFAEEVGAPYAVACSSGTAALHIAALAAGLGPGETAVVPAITFVATANAVRLCGAEVVFADVDPKTGLMTPSTMESALRRCHKPPRAVLPVHFAGQPADLHALHAACQEVGALLIEDACHALGTEITGSKKSKVGDASLSMFTAFSLHPVKTIAGGEGGVVTTRDHDKAEQLKRLRSHGINREPQIFKGMNPSSGKADEPWYYEMIELGLNYRLSDIHCALAMSQLSKLAEFVEHRASLMACYRDELAALAPLVRPLAEIPDCRPGWHLCVVLIDFEAAGTNRATVMMKLTEKGIGTQVHYIPVHRHPYYEAAHSNIELPGADFFYRTCLSLPLFVGMSKNDVLRVVSNLSEALCI